VKKLATTMRAKQQMKMGERKVCSALFRRYISTAKLRMKESVHNRKKVKKAHL